MSEIMKQPTPRDHEASRQPGPQSLNRDARKKELIRITNDNQTILKRIQQAQPVYNHVEWEGWHKKKVSYLKNCAEYPLVLRTPRRGNASSALVPLGTAPEDEERPETDRSSHRAIMPPEISEQSRQQDVKYVFKQGVSIRGTYYLVEMMTDGCTLNIIVYDGETQSTMELLVKEKTHRRLYRETNGDYAAIAQKLNVDGNRLILEGLAPGSVPALPAVATDTGMPAPTGFRPPLQAAVDNRSIGESLREAVKKPQGRTSPEEIDAEAMVVFKSRTGSAGSATQGSVSAQIDLNSSGDMDPHVRLRGLTPSSGREGTR